MFGGLKENDKVLPLASEALVDFRLEDWGQNPHIQCGYSSPSVNSGGRADGLTAR